LAEVPGHGLGRQLGPKSCLLRINRRGPRPLSINDWFTIPKDRSFQAPASAASDMTTTAEGVETEQRRNLLSILGCTDISRRSPSTPGFATRYCGSGGLKRRLTLAIQTAATIRNRAGWNAMNRGMET
jgi:hypothetical protein